MLIRSLGQFTIHFAQGVARNSNLNKIGRELGLERFINVGGGGGKVEITGKKMADTIEAILGAIYLDSGREKAKDVMDALGLLPKEQLLERQFEAEGLVMLEPEDAEDSKGKGKKRRKSDAS